MREWMTIIITSAAVAAFVTSVFSLGHTIGFWQGVEFQQELEIIRHTH